MIWIIISTVFGTLLCVGFGWWLRGATEWQKVNMTSQLPPILPSANPETEEETLVKLEDE